MAAIIAGPLAQQELARKLEHEQERLRWILREYLDDDAAAEADQLDQQTARAAWIAQRHAALDRLAEIERLARELGAASPERLDREQLEVELRSITPRLP
jgi:hypothetical protein